MIQKCSRCKMTVIPKSDGRCPSCNILLETDKIPQTIGIVEVVTENKVNDTLDNIQNNLLKKLPIDFRKTKLQFFHVVFGKLLQLISYFFSLLGAVLVFSVFDDVIIKKKMFDIANFIFICVAGVFGMTGEFIRNKAHKIFQNDRNRKASAVATLVIKNGIQIDFSLYIRPFITKGTLFTENPKYQHIDSLSVNAWFRSKYLEFETIFQEALDPLMFTMVLGRSDGQIRGFGAYETKKEDWKEKFCILAKAAKIIICLPSYREGTKWEISWIKENELLNKTLFFCPPTSLLAGFNIKEYWNETAKTFKELSFQLPPLEVTKFPLSSNLAEVIDRKFIKKIQDQMLKTGGADDLLSDGFVLFTLDQEGKIRDMSWLPKNNGKIAREEIKKIVKF